MANHLRQQLREAVATRLNGLTTTSTRVFQSRVYALESGDLPALKVYALSDEVQDATVGTLIGRRCSIVIEGCAKAAADLDDVIDTIAKEVEVALATAVTVSGRSTSVLYEGCSIDFDADAAKPHGLITMSFSATLYHDRATPDAL